LISSNSEYVSVELINEINVNTEFTQDTVYSNGNLYSFGTFGENNLPIVEINPENHIDLDQFKAGEELPITNGRRNLKIVLSLDPEMKDWNY
jgi:hypothetical protein